MRKKLLIVYCVYMLIGVLCQCQNATYKHYAVQSDLEVAYLEGFQLDSHNKMDVLLIIAKDDTSWQRLTKEFNIPDTKQGNYSIVHMLRSRANPIQLRLPHLMDNCFVMSRCDNRTIAIYYFKSENQVKLIVQKVTSLLKSNE